MGEEGFVLFVFEGQVGSLGEEEGQFVGEGKKGCHLRGWGVAG